MAEAAGKYACEYMTRGRVLIIGPIENEIGSGMTGGELFQLIHNREVATEGLADEVRALVAPVVDGDHG